MDDFQDNCIFDYHNLNGFKGRVLAFSKASVQMIYPEADIRTERLESYGREVDVFALYFNGETEPKFYIDQAGGVWNETVGEYRPSFHAFTLFVRHNSSLILGRFKVGETRFKDFEDERIEECSFWIDGSKFICMGGDSSGGYSTRFIFNPPVDFTGNFGKAPRDVLDRAVLSEARFFFAGERDRAAIGIKNIFSEDEATAQMKEILMPKSTSWLGKLTGKKTSEHQQDVNVVPSEHSGPVLNLMDELLKSRFSSTEARKAYLVLADLAIYSTEKVAVKGAIKNIFKTANQSESHYLNLVSAIDLGDAGAFGSFILSFDWKQEIADFKHRIEVACEGSIEGLSLPSHDEFPEHASISSPHVIERYQAVMNENGLDLNFLDSGGDTWMFLITPLKNRKRVKNMLSTAGIG